MRVIVLSVCLATVFGAAEVHASGCRSFSYVSSYSYAPVRYSYAAAYVAPTYYVAPQQVVVEKVVRAVEYVPVAVPAYAVGYQSSSPCANNHAGNGNGQQQQTVPQQPSSCATELAPLLKRIGDLEQYLLRAQQQQTVPPAAQPMAPIPQPAPAAAQPQPQPAGGNLARFHQVMSNRCASCHEQAVAVAKGKGLVLLQSNVVVALTAQQRLDVLREISTKRMPKGVTLPDDEFQVLVEALIVGDLAKR